MKLLAISLSQQAGWLSRTGGNPAKNIPHSRQNQGIGRYAEIIVYLDSRLRGNDCLGASLPYEH